MTAAHSEAGGNQGEQEGHGPSRQEATSPFRQSGGSGQTGRRFGPQLAEQPLAALVNVALPEESRILQAPLAAEAGGWGLWREGAWPSVADPSYIHMRELVRGAIVPLEHHDLAGTCGRSDRCLCDCCWVRLRNGQDKVPGTVDLGAGTRPSKGVRQ